MEQSALSRLASALAALIRVAEMAFGFLEAKVWSLGWTSEYMGVTESSCNATAGAVLPVLVSLASPLWFAQPWVSVANGAPFGAPQQSSQPPSPVSCSRRILDSSSTQCCDITRPPATSHHPVAVSTMCRSHPAPYLFQERTWGGVLLYLISVLSQVLQNSVSSVASCGSPEEHSKCWPHSCEAQV